ncbi:hypothetical protein RF11_10375 [Thelohanellus kitauei]|uniref:Uncharacterized protein n=1 Tax=Thelohanellus kitauei TaxID=669202 RepID=A0A0C2JTB8_THEKT|nr:hypothetical protein RF11_10375 [Thelohanellus kitauei]
MQFLTIFSDERAIGLIFAFLILAILIIFFKALSWCILRRTSSMSHQTSDEIDNFDMFSLENTIQPPEYDKVYDCGRLSDNPTTWEIENIKNFECPPYSPKKENRS